MSSTTSPQNFDLVDLSSAKTNKSQQPNHQKGSFSRNGSDDNLEANLLNTSESKAPKSSFGKDLICAFGTIALIALPLVLFVFSGKFREGFAALGEKIRSMEGSVTGYLLIICVGLAIILSCLSPMLYEMIISYALQSFTKAFLLALVYRTLGMILIYIFSKTFLRKTVERKAENSKVFNAIRYLTKLKPWTTLLIVRFSYLPAGLVNYCLPVIGYGIVEYTLVGILAGSFFVTIGSSFGLSARSIEELQNMQVTGGPSWLKYVPMMTSFMGASAIIYLYFYTKRRVEAIMRKYELHELKGKIDEASEVDHSDDVLEGI